HGDFEEIVQVRKCADRCVLAKRTFELSGSPLPARVQYKRRFYFSKKYSLIGFSRSKRSDFAYCR
ncbi:hypothetical protein, partial [Emergencia timonensis]|uniref:hypothetical protein n=1 Tax=Emergencia timonensis TaxID=1776384 RepID=UPI0039954EB8